jgi:methionine-rich copper-binding protein CopC
MKKFLIILLCMLPVSAPAHAVPTSYVPDHGATLTLSPLEMTVTFTDRVDPKSVALILHSATGTPLQLTPRIDQSNPRMLHATLPPLLSGATIMWGVISLDDGHYTRKSFNFSVSQEGSLASVNTEKKMSEAHLIVLLFILATILIILRAVSWLFLEKQPRCTTCLRSYTLLEALMAVAVITVLALLFVVPPVPEWKMETKEDGISVTLHSTFGSPLHYLTVLSSEDLPAPLFEISNREASIDPMPIAVTLVPSGDGGEGATYSFPVSVFVPYGNWHVSTTFIRGNHYDVHGAMTFVYPDDAERIAESSPMHSRSAWGAIAIAFLALISTLFRVVKVVTRKNTDVETLPRTRPLMAYGTAILTCILILVAAVVLTCGVYL